MRNINKFILILVFINLQSLAYAQISPEGMGFNKDTAEVIPALVQNASKSVFRLVVPAGNRVSVAQLFNGKTTAEAIDFVNGLDQAKLSKTDKLIFIFQLQECLKNPSQACTLFEGVDEGTGFVVADGTKIYTAYHVIKSIASSQMLPIFIVGPDQEVIFSPNDIALTIQSIGNTNAVNGLDINVQNKLQDVVILQSSVKIAEPLKPAIQKMQAGSKVYMTGFPMPTSDRKTFGALDSDGISKYTSSGHILSRDEIKNIAQKKFGGISDNLLNDFVSNLIISSADGAPGLSGAPTLNENGEYVGIYTSGAPVADAAVDRISYSTPVN
jgi:hypothetical protein